MLAGLWWAGCAVPLVFIDTQVHRLPDILTLPAVAGVFALLTVGAATDASWDHLFDAVICAAVAAAAFLVLGLIMGSRSMGLGDIKLLISVTALLGWWGWSSALAGVYLGLLSAGLVGVVLLIGRRIRLGAHIAVGPFFIAGAVVMLALLAWAPPG
ncbi:prepilin peptidase [Micromonospora globbae]|nr:prepilin peptidase [Micromonospora globbae]